MRDLESRTIMWPQSWHVSLNGLRKQCFSFHILPFLWSTFILCPHYIKKM